MATFEYELDLSPGIFSDNTTFSDKGRWVDCDNVRFLEGRPQAVGYEVGLSSGFSGTNKLFMWRGVSSAIYLALASSTKLYRIVLDYPTPTIVDITPASGWTGASGNSLDNFGEYLMACNSGGKLFAYAGSGVAALVTQAPVKITSMLVSSERQVLAFGCNEEVSGAFNSRCIRGSDLEDYTSWTTSSANNVFEHVLDSAGAIITARRVGSVIGVWTETDVYMGQYIGDPGQTYRFERVGASGGCASLNAVTVVDQTAYWMGRDRVIRSWTPGSLPIVLPCPISQLIVDQCRTTYISTVFAEPVSRFNEVWFYYPDARDGATMPSRYVAVSLKDGSWFKGSLANVAVVDHQLAAISLAGTAVDSSVISVNDGGQLVASDLPSTARPNWFIQSADQYLESGRRRIMVQGINPDFEQQLSDVSLTLYMRDRPTSTAVTKGPYTLAAGSNKKDFRASGMIMAVRFSGSISGGCRLGKPVFRCVTQGGR